MNFRARPNCDHNGWYVRRASGIVYVSLISLRTRLTIRFLLLSRNSISFNSIQFNLAFVSSLFSIQFTFTYVDKRILQSIIGQPKDKKTIQLETMTKMETNHFKWITFPKPQFTFNISISSWRIFKQWFSFIRIWIYNTCDWLKNSAATCWVCRVAIVFLFTYIYYLWFAKFGVSNGALRWMRVCFVDWLVNNRRTTLFAVVYRAPYEFWDSSWFTIGSGDISGVGWSWFTKLAIFKCMFVCDLSGDLVYYSIETLWTLNVREYRRFNRFGSTAGIIG